LNYFKKGIKIMALKHKSENGKSGGLNANGGICPTGVHFKPFSNPHGAGCPDGYDDTLSGVDGDIKDTMKEVRKAFKPGRA
jgi:hypothetical protein